MSDLDLSQFNEPEATILVVDDEDTVRESIVAHLEDSGFECLQANDGEAGLKLFRDEKPDCILTDIDMPKMRGIDFLSAIVDESPDTPVIVVSGAGVMQDAVNALRLGAWDYLIKPIPDLTVLEHAVCKSLEQSRLKAENIRYRAELETMNQKLKESLDILQEDQEAGRAVQTSLLPQAVHQTGEYTISHKIEPSLYLSGDFVDHFQIDKMHFGFYIADVSGHGASSAFVTVLLKSLMNTLLTNHQAGTDDTLMNPENVLSTLSKEVYEAKMGKYLTMVYGVLNLETHELKWSIGGHFPYPLFVTGNKVEFLENKGFPIGITASAEYECHTLHIPENAKLAMFSDGILEISPESELAEQEKHLKNMVLNNTASVDAFFEALQLNELDALPDDITMLLLQRGQLS
ncbi:MAG: fused response regulator/phosphatase [Legionellales bacterium]|nr:fused response regulator/phosphatase [Legionellales bacterium]